ncbi:AsmA family protein [Veronia nyctiphanis]|uniref:AsmA family protein n=1 Tax=Veronia nyctiphanis TaxID=1278244 RepID=A0A4Q0YSH5_9GAMM|nr:AsmA family protein [Veronia nyctiphanis]RXJ73635.1 AsmA family protein [Veronia nyctiphanis]
MKKILSVIVGLFVALIVGVVILVNVINPNQFKPLLVEQVKNQINRDLVIEGDISWRFWPSLGFSIDKLALKNPQGFAESDLISIGHAEMSVAVMPLLSDTLEVGLVSLKDSRVYIQTLANGESNFDGMSATSPSASSTESAQSPTKESSNTENQATEKSPSNEPALAWKIEVKGVELLNASAVLRDDKAASLTELSDMNLTIGEVKFGEWVPIAFDIQGKQNTMRFAAKGAVEAKLAQEIMESQLKDLTFNADLNDAAMRLDSASIDIDQLALGSVSKTRFSAKGEASGMSFDSAGELSFSLNSAMTLVSATGIELSADLAGDALPKKAMKVAFMGDAAYDLNKKRADLSSLSLTADNIEVNGNANVTLNDIPAIRFALSSNDVDLDAFLGLKSKSSETPPVSDEQEGRSENDRAEGTKESVAKKPVSDVEPDLSALKGLDLAGQFTLGKLKAANVKVSDVALDLAVNRGLVSIKQFNAKLYEGTVLAKAKLDARKAIASHSVNFSAKSIQIQPLLMDAAQQDILAGKGNVTANVRGVGLSEKKLRSGITGTVDLNLADGAVKGINVAEMIREARAAIKGQKADYVKEERKTDFSGLTATFKLGKGVASTNNVKLEAPLVRVRSEGQTSLVKETLDFDVFVSVVETSKGQGGKDIDELKDVTIPVNVFGTWQAPDYNIDFKTLLKANASKKLEDKARKEAERGLKKLLGDKVGEDETKDLADKLLKGLFN